MLRYLAVLATGALSALIAQALLSSSPSPRAADVTPPGQNTHVVRTVRVAPGNPDLGAVDQTMRAAIREELAAHMDEASPTTANGDDDPIPSVLRAEFAEGAFERVEGALASGRWSAEDSAYLREAVAHLSPDQQIAVLSQLAPAINDGSLEVEHDGPIL